MAHRVFTKTKKVNGQNVKVNIAYIRSGIKNVNVSLAQTTKYSVISEDAGLTKHNTSYSEKSYYTFRKIDNNYVLYVHRQMGSNIETFDFKSFDSYAQIQCYFYKLTGRYALQNIHSGEYR